MHETAMKKEGKGWPDENDAIASCPFPFPFPCLECSLEFSDFNQTDAQCLQPKKQRSLKCVTKHQHQHWHQKSLCRSLPCSYHCW